MRFVASVAAPARPAPLRALFGAPKRLALILTWIAAALLVSFATAGVTVAATPNGVVPVITGISPTSGPATGGTTVIITGAGFTSGSTVLFGTTPAASFTITSGTSISAVSPAGGGTVDIRVQKLNSESAPSSADQFTYTSSTPAPTVTGVNPSSGPPTGGTSVTLTGTNFVGVVGISFGGVAATSFTTNSSTQITVVAPPFSTSGSVNVIVTAQGGVSAANGNAVYTYMNTGAPTVTGLSPSGGPTSGGTGVLITGTNFTGATAVTFGSTPAPSFTVNSATSITATSPAGSAGAVAVTVTTSAGTSLASTADQFTYTAGPPAPVVTSVSPNSGPTAGGTSVVIGGSGLTGATAVKFGATAATSFTVNSDSQITATSPAGSGAVDVTVVTPGGTSAVNSTDKFTYSNSTTPTVTGLAPSSGPGAGGTSVTITGTNLNGVTGVVFGTLFAGFSSINSTTIQATSPEGAGTVDVTVVTSAGTTAITAADQFTYTSPPPAPTVNSVFPNFGAVAGGTVITLGGGNFVGVTAVKFGNTNATSFALQAGSTGNMSAVAPAGVSGPVDVTVVNGGGTSPISSADVYTYSGTASAPAIGSITPTSGPAAGGTVVTISGAGFSGATAVKFGTQLATNISVHNDEVMTATSPAGSGTVDVSVTTSLGTSESTSGDKFSYAGGGGGPAITAINPTGGTTTGGTSVTIAGSGFTGATAVKFGTKAATSFTVNSDTQVTAVSPSGSGAVDITITTPNGTSATIAADKFTYGAVPAVTRVNPTSGPSTGGTAVTVSGSGFTGATGVTFGGVAAQSFSVTNTTTLTAVSPPGSGTVDVLVTTPVGTSVARTLDHFTYTGAAPPPTVTSISPTSGPTAGGTSVAIMGTNFTGATAVKFGTATATFTVNSATSITATSPAGSAGTVDITVTTSAGISVTATADQFTYQAQASSPTVTSVSPTSGSTGGGTSVTITGTNLTGATAVKFGTAAASFTINSATSITAISPVGAAGTVDVTVATAAGISATGAADQFTYTAPPPAPMVSGISPNSGPSSGGTLVTITGSGFTNATGVKFGINSTAGFSIVNDTQMTVASPAGQQGTVDVVVSSTTGSSAVTAADQFTYNTPAALPKITQISPTSGAAGVTVNITGSGFTGATSVSFGGLFATFTVQSDGAVQATAPVAPDDTGTLNVTVTTPAGTSATTSAAQFTYVNNTPQPTVSAVSPDTGALSGGNSVVITGSNFVSVASVRFGSNFASSFTVNSATQITAVAPPGNPGTIDVLVVAAGGGSPTSSTDHYTYLTTLVPVINVVSPAGGGASGGTPVVITGTGFTGATSVTFGGAAATNVVVTGDTEIQALSPAGSGVVDVKVTNPVGTSATSASDQFTYTVAPAVTQVSPSGGPAAGGTSVTITGSGFSGATGVEFGTTPANFTVSSATSITAVAPLGAGTVDVRVITPAGVSATSSADHFAYSGAEPPVVTGFSLTFATGPAGGGTTIVINGYNFLGAIAVKFGTVPAASFSVNGDDSITVVSPPGSVGVVDVTVTTSAGTSAVTPADEFTYSSGAAAPTVTALSVNNGPIAGGTSVTITGTNFTSSPEVFFGGQPATSATFNSATSVTAVSPQAFSPGLVDVQVQAQSGLSAPTPVDRFTYTGTGTLPTVSGVSPNNGPLAGGTQITITGTNLSGAQRVYFGGPAASTGQITANSATSLTVTSPGFMAGAVDLQVETPGGVSAVNSSDTFTYVANFATVTAVSPNTGPIEGGTTVTLTGTNFNLATQVFFGQKAAQSFKVTSATSMTAVSPSGITGPVDVVVFTADGSGAGNPGDVFTYAAGATDPTISSVSPDFGPETGGAAFTVNGTNFVNVSKVFIGGVTAGFTADSATSLTVFPVGGSPGTYDVSVMTATGVTPTTAADHYTVYAPARVTGVVASNGPTTGGNVVTIQGSGFTAASSVQFGAVNASFSITNDSSIAATVPAGAAGAVDVTVTNPVGTSPISLVDQYTYTSSNSPTVSLVTPNQGPSAGGTTITVIGSHLTGATQVLFGNVSATNVVVVNDTTVTAVSPAASAFSTVDVRVVTPSGISLDTGNGSFSYSGNNLLPQITAISPTSGPTSGGTSVTITGTNFTDANSVIFGSNPAASFTVNSATTITAVSPPGSGIASITVATAAGAAPGSVANEFTYANGAPAPTVSSIGPNSGPAAGGTVVAIQGLNLTGATAVKFGGVAATSFTVNNANLITVVAPASPSGIVDVQVVTAGGTSAANSGDQFTFAPTATSPTVTSINPTHGPSTGGTSVVVTGTNFTGATAVNFGSTPAASFVVNSSTQITAVSPPALALLADISVTTPQGTSPVQGQSTFAYDFGTAPVIFSISPTSGPTAGGTTVFVSGTNLTNVTSATFGTVAATGTIQHSCDCQIAITSPADAAGTVDIKLSGSGGSTTITSADQFTFVAVPIVTSVSPTTGSTAGGTKVTVTGSTFTGATGVKFGATPAASFTINSDTSITATSPAGSAGTVDITVTAAAGVSAITAGDRFVYAASAPAVSGLAPSSGTTAGGTSVVISGSFFTGTTAVKFGSAAAASFTVNSDNQITAVSPAGAAGAVDVIVTTANGASAATPSDHFTYSSEPLPVVTGVSPTSGPASGGNTVTITGSGFTSDSVAKFGSNSWLGGSINGNGTSITASVPPGSIGTVDVTVTNAAGTSATSSADKYAYTASTPTISSISPTSGGLAGGYLVFLTGTNYNGATGVMFGTTAATTFSVESNGAINVFAPPGVPGTVDITVLSPSGTSPTSAADKFTYVAPTITSVTPSTGPTTGGTSVAITGQGFTGATTVKFGSTSAPSFVVNSDTQITATSPAESGGVVDITVTTPQTTSATGAADKFTFATFPVVTGISPSQGDPAGGTTVVISGSGFTGATSVTFATSPAISLTVNSDSQITVVTPPGSGLVSVVVTTPSGSSNPNQASYLYSNAPAVPTITSINSSSGSSNGGATVTITGTNFIGASAVGFTPTTPNGVLSESAQSFTVNSDTSITLVTPFSVPGSYDLRVNNAAGQSAATSADVYTFNVPSTIATVTAVSPNSGSLNGNTTVTVTGTNFVLGQSTVRFGNDGPGQVVSATGSTSITVLSVANGATGSADITVQTPAGTSATSSADKFTWTAEAAPSITSISPNTGPTSGGTRVTINGVGFNNATVKFGSTQGSIFGGGADNQIVAIAPAGSAGTVDITVTTSVGTSAVVTADKFTYSATASAPAITKVAPNNGYIIGGTAVDIQGSGFTGVTSVKFGSVTAASVEFDSDDELTVVSPAAAAGAVDITITTPAGTSPLASADKFTFIATGSTPSVTGLSPNSGPTAGGTVITITGSSFTGATGVMFGSTAATTFSIQGDGQIMATAPAGAAGAVDVTVQSKGGSSAIVAADKFTYSSGGSAPTVTAISPTGGTTAGGTSVTITGTNLTGATAVKFGATAAATFTVNSATQITVTSPAGSAGTVDITVTTSGGTSATGAADQFTYATAPTVTAVAPTSGTTAGGTSVVITGANFTGATGVKFGATAAATFTVNSATQVTATSPAGSAGTVDVTVTTVGGTSATSASDHFTYASGAAAPVVTKVSPAGGVPAGGTSVTITGSGFTGATAVKFGTKAATSFTVNSDTQVTAVSPSGTGTVDITVATANGTSATGAADQYVYQAQPAVSIVSPTSGSAGGGTSVTITGSAFTGATQVKFGANPAASFTVVNATKITAVSPAGSGTVDVQVTTPTGTSAARITDHFTYTGSAVKAGFAEPNAAPVVTSVSPNSGAATGGYWITLTGTNFTGATAVKFGTTPAAGMSVASATSIMAFAPAGSGVVDMIVTTPSGTSTAHSADHFTFVGSPSEPVITGLSPPEGLASGGTVVTLTGTNFSGATVVKFGGVSASFTLNSATQITATAPPGTANQTVQVTVTNASGTSATGEAPFLYLPPPPTVTGLSPSTMVSGVQGTLTITGTNFVNFSGVTIGGVAAGGDLDNSTTFSAGVPQLAPGVYDVVVTTLSGSSAITAADKLTITAQTAPKVTAISPSGGSSAGGYTVTITGSGFVNATSVKFGSTAATNFSVNSDTQVTATAPAVGGAGSVDVTVANSTGASATSAADVFTYTTAGLPSVTSLSPSSGSVLGGTSVTISGANFTNVSAVRFGTVIATFSVVNANTLSATVPASASAGAVDVTVVNAVGTSATGAADQFTYLARTAPTVTGVVGGGGVSTVAGQQLTIDGTGFTGATAVKFGALAATSFTVVSDSQITAVTPAEQPGTVDVTVTTPFGTSAASASDQVTFIAPAVVTQISPASGSASGGTSVTLTGSGFTGATNVIFGDDNAKSFKIVSDSKITAVTPPGSGVEGVRVFNQISLPTTSNVSFTFTGKPPAPKINGILPTSGSTAGGTVVGIEGANFFGVTSVTFGGVASTSFTVDSDGSLRAVAPPGSGVVDIRITAAGGATSVTSADKYTYTAPTAPNISGISPNSGATAGGTTVTIGGTGFAGATAVNFGSVAATSFTVVNDTQITAVTPAESASPFGGVSVTVTTALGTSFGTAASDFNFVAPVPAVTAITPSSGSTAGGTSVKITGSGFTAATAVKFGAAAATAFTVNSDSQITVTSPAGSAGAVDVTVATAGGVSATGAADQFTYTASSSPPTVTAVAPTSGTTAGGTSVTLTGTNFTGATGVKFGATTATFTVNSATQITATSPAGSAGTVDVTVATSGGTSATSNADHFTYATSGGGAPTVTAVNPNGGAPAGGTSVTIAGSGFTGATAVKFGTRAATAFTVNSDTQVTATSPAGTGTVDITVATPNGTSATGAADQFVYQAVPAVASISPVGGPATGGTTVTINGSTFTGATQVMFGSTPATNFSVASANKITAVSPAGSGTVDIQVTTPTGTSVARITDRFTYKASGAVKAQAILRVRTGFGTAVTVDLTRGRQASGGKVTLLTPSSAGAARVIAGATPNSAALQFTPAPGFSGSVTVSYALDVAAPGAADATGDVEITVDSRPDPSADPGVRGVIQAETDASLRFADAQISNFNQHLESLHSDGRGKGGNGVSFNFGFGQDQPNLFAQRDANANRIIGDQAWPTPVLPADPRAKQATPSKYPAHVAAAPGAGLGSGDSPLTVWTGGAISFGQTDAMTLRPGFRFTSDGLSAGVDARISGQLTLGAGAGVGQSYAQVDGGSRVDGHDFVGVLYGDWRPVKSAYVDLIAGWGRLDFTSHRIVSPGVTALGDRSGDDPFVSMTAGWIIARDGGFKLTPYARVDEISGRLDAFSEHGAGSSDLRYDDQSFNSLQGTLGLRGEWRVPTGYGDWTPRFRFEAHHQFDGAGQAGVNYADDLAGPPFTTQSDPMRSDSVSAGVGADLHFENKTLNLDYTATSDLVRQTVHELSAKLAFKFW